LGESNKAYVKKAQLKFWCISYLNTFVEDLYADKASCEINTEGLGGRITGKQKER